MKKRESTHCVACNKLLNEERGYLFNNDLCEECSIVVEINLEEELEED